MVDVEQLIQRERRFRKLVDISPIGIIVMNEGIIRYVNSFAEEILTNGNRGSVKGDFLTDYIHQDDLDFFKNIITNPEKDSFFFNIHFIRNNAKPIQVEFVYKNIYKNKQTITTVFFKDITLQEETKRRLKETEEKYRLISNNTSDLISIIDCNGVFQYVSPSHEAVLGLSLEKFIGKSVIDFVLGDDRQNFEKLLLEVTKQKQSLMEEIKYKSIDGNEGFSEVRATPIDDASGDVETIVLVARETTERRENEELTRKLDKLSVVGQVAASIAHEIRNPLTSIKGFQQLLEASFIDDKQRFYYDIISKELNKIESFVNKFMKLAHPEVVHFQTFKLKSLLENSFEMIKETAYSSNIKIVTVWDTEKNIKINGQADPLKQAIVNILNNAIEASTENSEIVAEVTTTKNKMVRISIIDHGHGISAERIPHLGTPFYTTREKGIGLGLTISFKVIREHHGSINVKSAEGVGTKVEILLPLSLDD